MWVWAQNAFLINQFGKTVYLRSTLYTLTFGESKTRIEKGLFNAHSTRMALTRTFNSQPLSQMKNRERYPKMKIGTGTPGKSIKHI